MKERRGKAKAGSKPVQEAASELTLPQLVDELATVLNRHHLSEVSIENEGMKICLRRGGVSVAQGQGQGQGELAPLHSQPTTATPPPPAAPAATAETSDGNVSYITSPFVGTFYRSPNPESAAFVEVGTRVKKGQVLCIVEAMKLMNEIESEIEG